MAFETTSDLTQLNEASDTRELADHCDPAYQSAKNQQNARLAEDEDRYKASGILPADFQIAPAINVQPRNATDKEFGKVGLEPRTTYRRAGEGSDWPVINERPSPDVVQQTTNFSCVAACGEMITDGAVKQETLIKKLANHWPAKLHKPELGADIKWLAMELGPGWWCGAVTKNFAAKMLDHLLSDGEPWVAEFRNPGRIGHAIVVDGINGADEIKILDPQNGTRYEMKRADFINRWSGRFVNHIHD